MPVSLFTHRNFTIGLTRLTSLPFTQNQAMLSYWHPYLCLDIATSTMQSDKYKVDEASVWCEVWNCLQKEIVACNTGGTKTGGLTSSSLSNSVRSSLSGIFHIDIPQYYSITSTTQDIIVENPGKPNFNEHSHPCSDITWYVHTEALILLQKLQNCGVALNGRTAWQNVGFDRHGSIFINSCGHMYKMEHLDFCAMACLV